MIYMLLLFSVSTSTKHLVNYFRKYLRCYCSSFAIKSVNPVNACLVVFPLMRMTSGRESFISSRGLKTHQQSILPPLSIIRAFTSVFFKRSYTTLYNIHMQTHVFLPHTMKRRAAQESFQ
jgi:hypothetical protein